MHVTIVAALPSTKNTDNARDPDMHQTKNGNEWYFGMKAHIGADADSGLVHSLDDTLANECDQSGRTEFLVDFRFGDRASKIVRF